MLLHIRRCCSKFTQSSKPLSAYRRMALEQPGMYCPSALIFLWRVSTPSLASTLQFHACRQLERLPMGLVGGEIVPFVFTP